MNYLEKNTSIKKINKVKDVMSDIIKKEKDRYIEDKCE